MKTYVKQDSTKRRSKELKSVERELRTNQLVGRILNPPARVRSIGFFIKTCLILFLILIFSSDSLLAQKNKKRSHIKKADAATADTLNAIIARHEWQFPIRTFWDDAVKAAQKSHRPVLA